MSARWHEHLRPRSPYEAIDFGFLFARAHYPRLVALAAAVVVPLAIALPLVVPGGALGASLVVWWLKPFWERPLLSYLATALFEAPPSLREVGAGWRGWATRDLLPSLTWRRLSPTRSFDLPITLLEGSTGRERAARLAVLHRGRFGSAAFATTILLAHVEAFVQMGLLLLIALAIPDAVDFDLFGWLFGLEEEADASAGAGALTLGVYVIAVLLVAPFYVGAGFALYLHRRTELEAWDLEVAFRRLAERVTERDRRRRTLARPVAAALAVLAAVSAMTAGLAASPPSALAAPLDRGGARAAIDEVLEGEAFHALDTLSIPKFLFDWELEREGEGWEWPEWLTDLFSAIGSGVAGGIEIVAVALAALALGWILLRFTSSPTLDALGEAVGPARRKRAPRELFGMEITEESLPDDLVARAASLAAEGRVREALALLYRGALSRLVLHRGADLPLGVTERECLAVATPLLPERGAAYFGALTQVWLRCAYGHLEPDADRVAALCAEWPRWFDASASDAESAS